MELEWESFRKKAHMCNYCSPSVGAARIAGKAASQVARTLLQINEII